MAKMTEFRAKARYRSLFSFQVSDIPLLKISAPHRDRRGQYVQKAVRRPDCIRFPAKHSVRLLISMADVNTTPLSIRRDMVGIAEEQELRKKIPAINRTSRQCIHSQRPDYPEILRPVPFLPDISDDNFINAPDVVIIFFFTVVCQILARGKTPFLLRAPMDYRIEIRA